MIALITGASSGIGEATARRLVREQQATCILVARREERLSQLAAELGPDTTFLALDLTEDDAPAKVAAHVREQHGGKLHLLVNNAGAAWRGSFADKGYENIRKHMELNFDAVVRLTEALLPLLRETGGASIVNVASVAGRVGRAKSGAYSASKFALIGWSEALHLEEKRHGVHVGTVLPGFIATEGFPQKELADSAVRKLVLGKPDDVAGAIIACGPGGVAERYVPRYYEIVPAMRILAPWLVRRMAGSSASAPATKHS